MSNFQVHTANPGNKTCKRRSQYTREKAWEDLKNDVKHLYVTEGLDLRKVQERLRSQGKYNFEATKRQWDYRLRQWGIYKNGKNATGGKRHRRVVTAPATQPEPERHTASLHDLAALSTATVSDDRSNTEIAMPVIEVEVNAITVSDDSGHDIDSTGTAVETNIVTVSDDSDHEIYIPGTAVGADASQSNSSAKPACGSMDLSWAFDMPLQKLSNGHPNDQHGFPLRALAEGLVELANDMGIAISDHTLFQTLQGLETCNESYQKSMVNGSWKFEVTKMAIGGSDVLIRVTMRHSIMTKRDYFKTQSEEEHRLALHLRVRSGRASPLDRGLTFASCFDCEITKTMSFVNTSEELQKLLDLRKTTVSCIISRCHLEDFQYHYSDLAVDITGLLLCWGLPAYHPSLTSGSLIIGIWSSFFSQWHRSNEYELSSDHVFTRCSLLTSVALKHGAPIDECIDDQGRNLLHYLEWAEEMQADQALLLLRYFQRLGLDIEHRDSEGKTLLLAALSKDYSDLELISTYVKGNANLGAVDNMGRGYLRIALERDGYLFGDSENFDFDDQAHLLAILLSADPKFKGRAITPSETPRLIELAFSAVAWDLWTSVFERLNWDMEEMNWYRHTVLDQPLPSYLEHYEEARLQMLAQTCFRLGIGFRRTFHVISGV